MLRVLMLVIFIGALAGCAPVSPGNSPAAAAASSALPAATAAPSSLPPVSSATPPATAQPAPTLAVTAGIVPTPVLALTGTVGTAGTVAATPAASVTGAVATASQPVIVLVRSGGFAGRTETWTVYADGRVVSSQGERRVAPELVSQFVAALTTLGFFNLQDAYGQNTQCRDCYNYRLTITSGGQSKTVSFVDNPADMPPGLSEVMAQLNSLLASAE